MTPHRRSRRRSSLGERIDQWLTRTFVWGPPPKPPRPPIQPPDEPTASTAAPLAVRIGTHVIAVALPVAVAALLIPLRETVTTSTATLVLVLPVVLVAMSGRATAGAAAAVAAALAFDVFLTRPYYSITMDAASDLESSLVLAAIALTVSTLVSREVEARTRSASRHRELEAIQAVAQAVATKDQDELVEVVTSTVADLLGARSCHWSPGFHGRTGAVLSRDGTLTGGATASRAHETVEVPVLFRRQELGRLIARVRSGDDEHVSTEERRTAIAVADAFAVRAALRT